MPDFRPQPLPDPEPTLRQQRCARRTGTASNPAGHCWHSYHDAVTEFEQCCTCELQRGIMLTGAQERMI